MAIRDTLELDIVQALADITTIGATFEQATSTFKVGIADAISSLAGIPPLEVTVDTGTVTGSINEAVSASDTSIVVAAEAGGVTTGINAAEDAANDTVPVGVDAQQLTTDIDNAIGDTSATIELDVQTTQAQQDITDLGDTASQATPPIAGLSTSLGTVADTAQVAGVGATGLLSTLAGFIPGGKAVAVTLGTVVAANTAFANSAVESQAATQRFQQTFGEFATSVQHVDVGSLDVELGALNRSLGSSTSETKNAAATFAQMGKSAGASGEQVANTTEQVIALTAAAVANNPQIGSIGSNIDNVGRALARGGPALGRFNIQLTQGEIATRALRDTGKTAASQLTTYEKSAAGAALATEKYGDSLNAIVAQGSQNPVIQLRAIGSELSKTTTELAKPLVSPLFDTLRSASPIIASAVRLLTTLGAAVFPLITTTLQALNPIFAALVSVITGIVGTVGPEFQTLFVQIAAILVQFAPVITALTPILNILAVGLATVAQGISFLLGIIDHGPGVIIAFSAALAGLLIALDINPIFLVITAIVGVVGIIKELTTTTEPAVVNTEQFRQAMFGTANTAATTAAKLAELNTGAKDYLATQSQFAQTGQLGALTSLGLDLDRVNVLLDEGTKGLKEFIAVGVETGKIKIKVDGADQSADQVRNLTGSVSELLASGKAEITQNEALVAAFNNEVGAREAAAKTQLDRLVATGEITKAQKDQAITTAQLVNGEASYTEALKIATSAETDAASSASSATDAKEAQAQADLRRRDALAALATEALSTGVSEEELKAKSSELGIEQDKLKQFTDGVKQSFESFKSSLIAGIPGINTVLQEFTQNLDKGFDPNLLEERLKKQTEALTNFQFNVLFLLSSGFKNLAQAAIQQGPAFTNALVESIKNGRQGLGQELNGVVGDFNTANAGAVEAVNRAAPLLFDASTVAGQQASLAFGQTIQFPGIAGASMAGVPGAIAGGQPGAEEQAGTTGQATTTAFGTQLQPGSQVDQQFAEAQAKIQALGLSGATILNFAGEAGFNLSIAFGKGIGIGLQAQADSPGGGDIGRGARAIVDLIEREINSAADAHSPAKRFIQPGIDIALGIAAGITAGSPGVNAAVNDQIDGLISTIEQRRDDGSIEQVFSFDDGSFVVATQQGIDRASSDLRGRAATALTGTGQLLGQSLAQGVTQGIDIGTKDVLSAQETQLNALLLQTGLSAQKTFVTLAEAIAKFGAASVLPDGSIAEGQAVVSGTTAAGQAIGIYEQQLNGLTDQIGTTTAANEAFVASLKGVGDTTSINPFFAPKSSGFTLAPGVSTAQIGTQDNSITVPVSVTVPPGVTNPDAFGAAVAGPIQDSVVQGVLSAVRNA